MKKRFLFFALSLVAMLAFVHCGDEGPEPALKLNETELSAEGEGGSMLLGVASNISWSAISSEGWCVLENYTQKGDGSIILRIAPNTTGFERSAKITVSGGSLKCEATVKQAGSKPENGGSNEGGGSQGGETPGGNEGNGSGGNGSGDDGGNTPTPTVKYPLTLGSSPSDGGTVSGGGSYDYGMSVTLKAEPNEGYLFSKWSDGVTNNPRTLTVTANKTLTAYFTPSTPVEVSKENGVLPGKFSVSATKKVQFAMGNLQYQASTKKWRFAENQYDVIGYDNENISATYSGWIDLFGYGTSGSNTQPYETSKDYSDYPEADIVGTNNDWGKFNAISNGGNKAGLWGTLTKDEMEYLMEERPNAKELNTSAVVCNMRGYIILPDDWKAPEGVTMIIGKSGFYDNSYNAYQWSLLEKGGALFLPCAGYRSGGVVKGLDSVGDYWSGSVNAKSTGDAYKFGFDFGGLYAYDSDYWRYSGYSVRLARVATE